jgi:threonine/homoserine/homoserine lactone efflux protein
MPSLPNLIAFSFVALAMVCTPGPNMAYLISRTINQGRRAGFISLGGIALGFFIYMTSATLGLTALLIAVPLAYDALRICGAVYLLYLAWQALRPGGRSPFQITKLPEDKPRRLFLMGLLTSLLNPKIAVMYLSLLPQFVETGAAHPLTQSLTLGFVQIITSVSVNSLIILMASVIAQFLAGHPFWLLVQRWFMGTVLAFFKTWCN